jgi:hypothetical protein
MDENIGVQMGLDDGHLLSGKRHDDGLVGLHVLYMSGRCSLVHAAVVTGSPIRSTDWCRHRRPVTKSW